MSATAETRVLPPSSTPPALDRAEGVELLGEVQGSGYRKDVSLVRRADGQMLQLPPLMYTLLESIDGQRSAEELAGEMSERLGRSVDVEQVAQLAEKLGAQGLLAGTEHLAPPRRNPLLALRWKVLVTNPRATRLLTAPFTNLFRPFVVVPVLAVFVAVVWFVLFKKGVASATAQAFHSPGLLLLVLGLAVFSAALHEVGHAAAARYGGATPGGMGMGLYLVWPAFYTDVTDAYRLPRKDRLRVDLGGIYFNALIAVAVTGAWLLWHKDALLLLVAIQFLMMVQNLSPVIRSDGYHILSDATGVPDLYAHIGPTLRRLLPWRRAEPSALKGRARALVTIWVLVIVPVLLSMMLGAILLLPRMMTTAWDSGRAIMTALPHESASGTAAALVHLLALVLPVIGSLLIAQRLLRTAGKKSLAWSEGSPARRALVSFAALALAATAAWAWWPGDQYQPIRPTDRGTLVSFTHVLPGRTTAAVPQPVRIAPGTHLALAMIPRGGATKEHPALYIIQGKQPVAMLATQGGTSVVNANVFPFTLPAAPGPGDTQALAVNRTDGGVLYDVAYGLITINGGAPVTNTNSAYALANCHSCTTVALSFQLVLIVGQSNRIAPINAAAAENGECPACMTIAMADQMVITIKQQPSADVLAKLQAALQKLNALPQLGAGVTQQAVADAVQQVQQEIEQILSDAGLLVTPSKTSTTSTTTTTSTTPTTTSSSTPAPGATTTAPAETTPTTTAPSPTTTSPSTTPAATTPTTTMSTTTNATTTTTASTTTDATTTTTP